MLFSYINADTLSVHKVGYMNTLIWSLVSCTHACSPSRILQTLVLCREAGVCLKAEKHRTLCLLY